MVDLRLEGLKNWKIEKLKDLKIIKDLAGGHEPRLGNFEKQKGAKIRPLVMVK